MQGGNAGSGFGVQTRGGEVWSVDSSTHPPTHPPYTFSSSFKPPVSPPSTHHTHTPEPTGQLTYMRVYQGTIKRGGWLFNMKNGKKVKVPRLVRMHSNEVSGWVVG